MHVVDATSRIHRLPDSLVNRIAAGEVIERPASVVKELLENCLDAGADRITIEIESGGSRLIRVTDNGHGIHADDLPMAVERHTTSKLKDDADLSEIATLGFRGEALSSIAAVSRFRITSCRSGDPHAMSLEAGRDGQAVIQPAAHPPGTTVEIRHIFHNTPARKKFLRSEKTEYLHILDLVKRIALSRFDLTLRLIHNQRQVFHISEQSRHPEQRVLQVLGRHFYDNAIHLNQRAGDVSLFGWMGLPDIARSQTDQQFFYLNGRIIRDRMVQHAIRSACQDHIYPGRYPVYVLYLQTGLSDVDINVHPTKYEVRFRDTRRVFDFIQAVITHALEQVSGRPAGQGNAGSNYSDVTNEPATAYYNRLVDQPPAARQSMLVNGRYLLMEGETGLDLVDIHAARELILLQHLLDDYRNSGIKSRPVLVPLSVKATPDDMQLLEQHSDLLISLGLQLEPGSPDTIMIRGLPDRLVDADAVRLYVDVLAWLKLHPEKGDQTEGLLDVYSRHANDSPARTLSGREKEILLGELAGIRSEIPANRFRRVCRHLDMADLQALF